jgi:hypothetical protein
MKRAELLKYLRSKGCDFIREGQPALLVGQSRSEQKVVSTEALRNQRQSCKKNMQRPWNRADKMSYNQGLPWIGHKASIPVNPDIPTMNKQNLKDIRIQYR